jgi:2-hydroxy-6-oxonona-2,4-dienedioate hydrolase
MAYDALADTTCSLALLAREAYTPYAYPATDASSTPTLLDRQHGRSLLELHMNPTNPASSRSGTRLGGKRNPVGKERKRMLRKTSTASVNGATLYHELVGEGEPLVLVHAGIADSRMWDAQIEAFAQHYRVLRYDMRGFGKSVMVEGPYSHHEDLRTLLDALDVGRAHLVGCSMGGATVLDFALRYPEKVRTLVLVGAAVSGFEPDVGPLEQWGQLASADEAGDLKRVSELEVQIWVDGPGRQPEDVPAAVRDLVREMNLIALRGEASELGKELAPEPPAADRLTEIRAPSLIIVGNSDQPQIIAAADLLGREIPNVRKVVMPGVAHLPNMERPEEFNRMVLAFLERSA